MFVTQPGRGRIARGVDAVTLPHIFADRGLIEFPTVGVSGRRVPPQWPTGGVELRRIVIRIVHELPHREHLFGRLSLDFELGVFRRRRA